MNFKDNDIATNALLFAGAFAVLAFLTLLGFAFAIPIAIVFAIGWYLRYQARKPVSTVDLVQQTTERQSIANFPDTETFTDAHLTRLIEAVHKSPPTLHILEELRAVTALLYEQEEFSNPLPPAPPTETIEEGRYRDRLIAFQNKIANPQATLELFSNTLLETYTLFIASLPALARTTMRELKADEEASAVIPLVDILKDPATVILNLLHPVISTPVREKGLFQTLRAQVMENMEEAGVESPSEFKGTAREMAHAFFQHTPLEALFEVQIPFEVPLERRLEHTVIVAGSGHGKTQLLQHLILNDLQKDDPPSLIIVDSTGAMVDRIQKLAVFNERLRDRLLVIDPADSPPLNMFDLSTPRFQRYSPEQREDVESEVVALFNYIFASNDYDLTSRQGTAFVYAVKLILSRPNSTITDLRRLLEEPVPKHQSGYSHSAFKDDIDKLDDSTRDFFANHFFGPGFVSTRHAIAQRLHKLIGIAPFKRMFTASMNALDLYAEMEKGTCVVVNTNQQLLKEDSYVLFGRYIIGRALAAAFERATVDPKNRRPTFLIIDEAAPYFDDAFEALLTRVRQFKLGVVIAFQHLDQASDKLRNAIASSTSVKYAGRLGSTDRRWMSREMETTEDFIRAQKRDEAFSRWACYVSGYTDTAVSLTVPFGSLENSPQMSDEQHTELLRHMRSKFLIKSPEQPLPTNPAPATPYPEPIVTLNPRPPDMEAWRLDKSSDAAPKQPVQDPGEPSDTW